MGIHPLSVHLCNASILAPILISIPKRRADYAKTIPYRCYPSPSYNLLSLNRKRELLNGRKYQSA
jgi:hypothetical protein